MDLAALAFEQIPGRDRASAVAGTSPGLHLIE
jgi:hypothetical protein